MSPTIALTPIVESNVEHDVEQGGFAGDYSDTDLIIEENTVPRLVVIATIIPQPTPTPRPTPKPTATTTPTASPFSIRIQNRGTVIGKSYCLIFTLFLIVIVTVTWSAKKSSSDTAYSDTTTYLPEIYDDYQVTPVYTRQPRSSSLSPMASNLPQTCKTSACERMAKELKSSMDTDVDPCEDFFHYACGAWNETGKQEWLNENSEDVFDEMDIRNLILLREIFEQLQPTADDTAMTKTKNFYLLCTNRKHNDSKLNSKIGESTHNVANFDLSSELDYLKLDPEFFSKPAWGLGGLDVDAIFCPVFTKNRFPEVSARLFVEKTYLNKVTYIDQVIEALRSAYKAKINSALWIDEESTDYLIRRFDALIIILGYPPEIMDIEAVNEKYADVSVSESGRRFFHNVLALDPLINITVKTSSNLNSSTEDEEIFMSMIKSTVIANAFYMRAIDKLFVPAGILMEPFFDTEYPQLINFARLATILGHEMTHAFERYLFDLYAKNGLDTTAIKFSDRLQCIEDQYSGFWVDNGTLQVEGNLTLHENFADIGGDKVAYEAYFNGHKYNVAYDDTIHNLEGMTPNKLFFVASAQKWCRDFANNTAKYDVLKEQVHTDNHSPNLARVLGQMSNFPEFSKTFNCRLGSKYSPFERCGIFE